MSESPSPAVFDAHAEQYESDLKQGLSLTGESRDYYVQGRIQRVRDLTSGHPTAILDYGCGTGGSIDALRESWPEARVVGTDLSEASLAVARRDHPEASFTGLEAYGEQGPFDLAHCNGVFHHIPPQERDACLRGIFGSLRPGGAFAFFENNPLNPGTRLVMKRIPFDRDAITLLPRESLWRLRRAGFSIERVEFLFFFPNVLRACRSLEPRLRWLPLGGQYLVWARRPQ